MNTNRIYTRLTWILLAVEIIFAIVIFFKLPDSIPLHFNLNNQPDEYGNKTMVFLLLGVNLLLYAAVSFAMRYKASARRKAYTDLLYFIRLFIPLYGIEVLAETYLIVHQRAVPIFVSYLPFLIVLIYVIVKRKDLFAPKV